MNGPTHEEQTYEQRTYEQRAYGHWTYGQRTYGERMDKTTAGDRTGEPSAARSGAGKLSRFADLAGVRLYRDNAFAVTGLPATARGRAVRQHRQRLEARLAVEDSWPGDPDSPLVGGHRRDEVRAAFEEFQDPRRRLVDELLWRWGEPGPGCGCPASVHEEHDDAVRFHALALEAEAGRGHATTEGRDTLWRGAASGWGLLLERPELRRHIAHRIAELDDPRLGAHTADDFLAALPRLLVSPFRELAADPEFRPRLARVCAGWAEHTAFAGLFSELFEETVEETVEKITDGLRSASEKKDAGLFGDAVQVVRREVLPAFERLGDFRAFVSDWQYEDVAHIVAVGVGNLAVAMLGHHQLNRPSPTQMKTVVELAEKAYEIAPERHVKAFKDNWDVIYEWSTRTVPLGAAPGEPAQSLTGLEWVGCWLIALGLVGLIVLWTIEGWEVAWGVFLVLCAVAGGFQKLSEWQVRFRAHRARRRFHR
ncbi:MULTISPECIES: hypothetical protein [unclassified Streptomyces]|uniref:hypothetical protein n=1 Tax=unclassified Streptomyces TaxID=2593676 RepID=UPI0023651F62|nr:MULTISPECIES: hypothetical protein [unclassified Streptomyces]MDF3142211.1 hypothetical protein [Streptomyces sp. T21Q-yed]WDF43116.1 hypothetical protein PBV52_43175 [Streptomyces sp. T12]